MGWLGLAGSPAGHSAGGGRLQVSSAPLMGRATALCQAAEIVRAKTGTARDPVHLFASAKWKAGSHFYSGKLGATRRPGLGEWLDNLGDTVCRMCVVVTKDEPPTLDDPDSERFLRYAAARQGELKKHSSWLMSCM